MPTPVALNGQPAVISFVVLLMVAASCTASPASQPGYTTLGNSFCSADRQGGANWHDAADAAACAKLCSSSGCAIFEWGCHRTKPCLLFSTVGACGHAHKSTCGSNLYVNSSFPPPPIAPPPPPPSPAPPKKQTYDVTKFETEFLPKWVAQYTVVGKDAGPGSYSWKPGTHVPHPYSPSDVAHVLCFTGNLGNITEAEKDGWAARINSFQRDDGFYSNHDRNNVSGGSLWHAAGYVTAGLSLLKRQPTKRNQMFEQIAADEALWKQTIDALLNADVSKPPYNISSGCGEGYACAQNIASMLSWFIQTNSSTGGLVRHRPFADGYFPYLSSKADAKTGLWCTPQQRAKNGVLNCIGGSFHIDFVFQYAWNNAGIAASHHDSAFPAAAAQLNTSLAFQKHDGAWSRDGLEYMDVDGIYQVTRPAIQLGKARWDEVEKACDALMAITTRALTDQGTFFGPVVSGISHTLPALVSAVAECQMQFPEMIKTVKPWKMCLNNVPYI